MICIAWDGFPQYGARCVGALVKSTSEPVVVVARRPQVPIKGMEEHAHCSVKWIDDDERRPLNEICGGWPRLMTTSGWGYPLYNRFRDEAREHGCFVVCGSDNNFIFSFRQCIQALRFRLLFQSKYDAFFVPGRSGVRLMRFFGVPASKIVTCSYSADEALFHDGEPLENRPRRMLFVGQLSERKNVLRLCEAFHISGGYKKGWTLDLYGSGPLRDVIPAVNGMAVHDFMQPEQLADVYRQSRCFVLPSIMEHWGVVVHEAALSGCVLLLSDCIGAGEDFLSDGRNGFSFRPKSVSSIAAAMRRIYAMSDAELRLAHDVSLSLSSHNSLGKYVNAFSRFDALSNQARMS